MIPKGHRIDLPRLDWMMQTLPGQLKLEYKVEKQAEKQKELDELFSGCGDIQEQLIKFLYTKTGIVLMKDHQTINRFLPHTMRELTHFVKLLYDMETVDVNEVYTNLGSPSEDNCEKLKKNLVEIREYFLENWCSEWLSVNQHKLLKEINEKSIKHDFAGLSRVFSKYMRKDVGKKITYRHIITGVLGENGIADLVLQNAISLYYTIFLNEWFAEAVMNPAQFEQLAEFLDYSVEIPQKVGNRRFRERYEVMRFEFSLDKLRSYIPESLFLCIKNIVANYELQMFIMECLEHDYRYFTRKKADISWGSIVNELYGNIDKYYQKAVKGLGIPGELKQRLMELFDNKILYLTFLANEGNLNAYLDEYVQKLKNAIKDVPEQFGQIGEGKETAIAVDAIWVEAKNNLAPQIIDLPRGAIPIDQVKKIQEHDHNFQEKIDVFLSSASDFDTVSGALEEIANAVEEMVRKWDESKQTGKRETK
jgi:hypothetical protein